ncbi:MAG: alpha-L-rhamnosidase N-terminal domain-containing protein, partial [Clostridia bacterium]|nr:alpha-L-rhamnosidase N-terminal domain-containing protein [Clostridia bacterium]
MFKDSSWIIHPQNKLYEPVRFSRDFKLEGKIKKATLHITSLGCYYAEINGKRVGNFILAPGFTSRKRVQYQSYDITKMLENENKIEVLVSDGWYKGKINFGTDEGGPEKKKALIATIEIKYKDNSIAKIVTDTTWSAGKDALRMAELYDGESVDMTYTGTVVGAEVLEHDKSLIVKQEGPYVIEQERLSPKAIFKAPNGETLIDFGQNL